MLQGLVTLECSVKMSPVKERVTLNKKEQNRSMVLSWVARGMMTAREAGEVLGLSLRQVKRILAAYRREVPFPLSSRLLSIGISSKDIS